MGSRTQQEEIFLGLRALVLGHAIMISIAIPFAYLWSGGREIPNLYGFLGIVLASILTFIDALSKKEY